MTRYLANCSLLFAELPLLSRPGAAREAGFTAMEFKPYPLRTADQAVGVVDAARTAGAANVGFLCDLYHLASNGDDVPVAIVRHAEKIAHVQIADAPGRGEPGSGDLDLDGHLAALREHGYDGWVSLEYKPTTTTGQSLTWLPQERRAGPPPEEGT
jgi:hydroxypyruvate isomerase